MATKPPFIEAPKDSSSWEFRLDCMAWELWAKKSEADRAAFIAANKKLQTEDFTDRIRKCKAWWWLAYLNRPQIEEELNFLPKDEIAKMREHLNTMRIEIKKHRQIENKTYMGATNHA